MTDQKLMCGDVFGGRQQQDGHAGWALRNPRMPAQEYRNSPGGCQGSAFVTRLSDVSVLRGVHPDAHDAAGGNDVQVPAPRLVEQLVAFGARVDPDLGTSLMGE